MAVLTCLGSGNRRTTTRLFSLLMSGLLCMTGQLSYAQSGDSTSGVGSTGALDLTSADRNIVARVPRRLESVVINVGDTSRTVARGDLLTPAEYVALTQVLSGRQQSLLLDASGSAVGGQFFLTNRIERNFNDVVVPNGVTALLNAGNDRHLDLAGSLVNSGNLFAYSSDSLVNSARISAATLTNNQGAALSSILPGGGLPGVNSMVDSLNLILNATKGDFANYGSVTSSGNLTVTAAGSIINALPAGVTGAAPVMQAMNNLNLVSGAGSIVNTNGALLAATTNNINISTLVPHDILINSLGGQVQALLGAINVRDDEYGGAGDIDISGGDWLSKELNLYSGTGDIRARLNEVTGNLSTHAGFANVGAATDNFSLGEICITGDPTFFNSIGSISINANITVAERLTILAAGNITSVVPNLTITARDGTGQGFDITVVAGASLAPLLGGGQTSNIPGTQATGNVTVNGPAILLTGNIDLSGASGLQILSNSTTGNLNGGNVRLLAFLGGASSTAGRVLLPADSTINTSGFGAGNNGNVLIMAGGDGSPTPVITVGNIIANGGTGASGGNVDIMTAQPAVSPGGVVFNNTGTQISGTFATFGVSSGNNVNIQLANSSTPTTIAARNNISITAGTAATSTIFTDGGNSTLLAGNDITLLAGGGVTTSPTAAGNGGNFSMTSGTVVNNGSISAPSVTTSATTSGNGGNVTAQDSSTGNVSLGTVTANGAGSGTGGTVTLTSGTFATMTTGAIQANGGATGSGGSVTVNVDTAVPFVLGTGGSIPSITASAGAGGGDGGDIIVRNSGAGGITLGSFSALTVSAPAGGGGSLELDAGFGSVDGPLAFPTAGGTLSATGLSGGVIRLKASTTNLSSVAGTVTLDASPSGDIFVTTTDSSSGADITLGSGTGQLNLVTGTGGSITVESGNDLTVDDSVTTGDLNLSAAHLMTLNNGVILTGDSSIVLTTPELFVNTLATLQTGFLGSIDLNSPGTSLTISTPSASQLFFEDGFVTITTTDLTIGNVLVSSNMPMDIDLAAGGSLSNAGFIDGNDPVATVTITFNGGQGTVTNTGTIESAATGNSITVQNAVAGGELTFLGAGGLFSQTNVTPGTTSFIADTGITFGDSMSQTIGGGGDVSIRTPNLSFAATTAGPTLTAAGASNISIDAGTAAPDVDLTIVGPSGFAGTIATGSGGTITIGPTGTGDLTFSPSGVADATINFNGAMVDMTGLGDFTFDPNIIVSSDTGVNVLMNNVLGSQLFTLNGTIQTTASNPGVPTILIQALFGGFALAGNGTILQAGANPGNTIFNDFTNITFTDGTDLTVESVNPGSSTSFFTQDLRVSSTSASPASATLTVVNNSDIFIGSFLPCPPCDVSFHKAGSATAATLNLLGAPISTVTSAPGGPVRNVTVGADFTLVSDDSVTINVADSATGSLALESNAQIMATGGDLNVQAAGDLLVTMAAGSMLQAGTPDVGEGFDLNFNPTAAGDITVDGGAGPVFNGILDAEGDLVTFNGGVTDVRVNEVVGVIEAGGLSVSVQSNSGLVTGEIDPTGTVFVSAGGTLVTTDEISGSSITLQTLGGFDIQLGDDVSATTALNVTANGVGNIIQTAGILSGTTINLASGTGNIGTPGANIMTDAANLTVNTGGTGDAFVMEDDSVSVGASSAGDEFVLSAGGNITTTALISAPSILLQTKAGSNGDITLGANIGQALGTTVLNADGSGDITQTAGTVLGSTADLSSGTGSIGTSPNPLDTAVSNLSMNTGGTGSVFVNQTGAVTLGNSSAGTDFQLTSSGATALNDIFTINGFLTVNNATGLLQTLPSAQLSAGSGDVTLQNDNLVAGTILLGANTRINSGGDPGNVFIVIGGVPANPVKGAKPAQVSQTTANGGKIFYGANSIAAVAPTNTVFASVGRVVFNTGSLPSNAITLNGNVRIGAVGSALVRSLDLTDPAVTAFIIGEQQTKAIGGKLRVDGSGVAVGGSVTLTAFHFAPSISALNIPARVNVRMNNFTATDELLVALTADSTTSQAVINGRQTFARGPSDAVMTITSTLGDTAFNLGSTGRLTSRGSLTINAEGDLLLNGRLRVKTNLALATLAGSDGTISIGGGVGSSKGVTTISADGSGSILQSGGTHVIRGATVTLASGSGDIGSLANPIRTRALNMSVNTDGAGVAFVSNSGNLTLGSSGAGGDFQVSASGVFNVGDVSTDSGSITLIATGGGKKLLNVLPGSTITANDGNLTLQHTNAGKGSIFIGANSTIEALAGSPPLGNVSIFIGAAPPVQVNQTVPANVTEFESLGGAIFYGTNSIVANAPNNDITAKGADVTFSTGTRPASAITLGGNVTITADPPVSPSSSLMPAAVSTTQSNVQLPGLAAPHTVEHPASAQTLSPADEVSLPPEPGKGLIPIGYFTGASAGNQAAYRQTETVSDSVPWMINETASTSLTGNVSKPVELMTKPVLIAPQKTIRVSTHAGELCVAGGSIVLVISTPEATVVYDLHDSRQGAVKLLHAHQELHVSPGRVLILNDGGTLSLAHDHPARSVGYRKAKSFQLRDGTSVYAAEFSISSAIQKLGIQQQLSPQSSKSMRILSQVLKTAAVLNTLRGQSEAYKPLIPPLVSSR